MAWKSFSANTRETASWSMSSLTETTSSFMTSRTRFSGGAANRSRNDATPRSFCASSSTYA